MKLNKKQLKILRWSIRILSVAILLFALPFYFGYGNPLPFSNQDYDFFDNLWLSAFPLIFLGLGLGLKWEKLGGYLIVLPTLIAFLLGLIILKEGLPGPMFVPLIIGLFYLFLGYKKPN